MPEVATSQTNRMHSIVKSLSQIYVAKYLQDFWLIDDSETDALSLAGNVWELWNWEAYKY